MWSKGNFRAIPENAETPQVPMCQGVRAFRTCAVGQTLPRSQMWRPTNWATPGYFAVTIIARKSCDSKSFPVCGHLCGQSGFSARFADSAKSSKRPCCKGFRVSAAPIVDESAYAPKPRALPSELHPDICPGPGIAARLSALTIIAEKRGKCKGKMARNGACM